MTSIHDSEWCDDIFLSESSRNILKESLILVTPSPYLKSHLKKLKVSIREKLIAIAIKGLVPDDNITISQYFQQAFNVPEDNITTIGGPSVDHRMQRK